MTIAGVVRRARYPGERARRPQLEDARIIVPNIDYQDILLYGDPMAGDKNWRDGASFPALLRGAWAAYGLAVREALNGAGHDDVPRNGVYVIGAIARTGAPLGRIIKELGISKQAAGQLVDTLVLRGYLDRSVDTQDRRRLTVALTERGRAAAAVSRSAVERLDAELAKKVGVENVAHTRAALAALVEIEQDGGKRQ